MSGVIVCNPPGSKLGNAAMSWLFAYAHAQRVGAEFLCPEWIGEKVFKLPLYGRPSGHKYPQRSEMDLGADETDVEIRGYAQNARAMIYTKAQAQEWLTLKHLNLVKYVIDGYFWSDSIVAHLRRGDFYGYGYPMVSVRSYRNFVDNFTWATDKHIQSNQWDINYLREEAPTAFPPSTAESFENTLSFLPDFYRMVFARTFLRANSSFSWLAGLLSNGRVFSPIIDGLTGGKEHDCDFVEGNWPRLSNLDGCGELHVKP